MISTPRSMPPAPCRCRPTSPANARPDARDREDYQTIWAKRAGAVAAPTASLHFDEALVAALTEAGIDFTFVTLHVGAGTFLPVTVDDVTTHRMHAEWGEVREKAADEINATRASGGRIIPVGTTALRLIETAADADGTMRPSRARPISSSTRVTRGR
jgi:S-adenosylmethionine:tRNA ribosyltransferase-isomerase